MRRHIVCLAFAVAMVPATVASATIRNVPADHATIQAAINASVNGDTVIVGPGTYFENLDFGVKTIRLLSSSGSTVTILKPNAATPALPLVRFAGGGSGTEFSGFTLDGGSMKHAIENTNFSRPWIHHNVITNHVSFAENATEVGTYSGLPVIEFNLFIHNRSIGGVGVFSGGANILNNTFDDCSRGFWSQGTGVYAKNNIVTNSTQFGIGDTRFAVLDYNCVFNNNPNFDYGAVPGPNDINAYPEYCDTTVDDYSLDAISPCLLTGEAGANRGAFDLGCGADSGPRVLALAVSGSQSMHVTDEYPVISWAYVDPDSFAQTESEIEVGTDADWSVPELWDPAPFIGPGTSQSYAGGALNDGTDYFVRARVSNGIQWGEWTSRLFHTNQPPPAPSLSAPADSAVVKTFVPVLQLNPAFDSEGDAQTFDYEVYLDEAMTTLIVSALNKASQWQVSPAFDPLQDDIPRWWRARPHDGFEYGPWSIARMFITDGANSAPTPGDLISPVGNIAVPTTAPHFDWDDAVDPDATPSTITQTLFISTDSAFNFSIQLPNLTSSGFTYGGLGVSQRYWWKVRFADQIGDWSESAIARFFIPGPGDMNMNQTINVVDIVLLTDVIFRGVPPPPAFYLADVNGDCVHNVVDVVELINHAFRNGSLPLNLCDAGSNVLRVPSEYPTITNAITFAAPNDTILVAPGVYAENLDFMGKKIHLVSESGPGATTLQPLNGAVPTITFNDGEPAGTEVSGFTITGGDAQHAIYIADSSAPSIHHNIIRDHVTFAYNATAIGSYNSTPVIEFNLFIHTRSLGGIGIFSGGGTIQNNTFDDNSRGYWSQGVGVIARSNIVTNSIDFGIGDNGFAVNDFNCLFGNGSEYCCEAVPGANDFHLDPEYCDRLSEDYRLEFTSQCVGSSHNGGDRGAFGLGCGAP